MASVAKQEDAISVSGAPRRPAETSYKIYAPCVHKLEVKTARDAEQMAGANVMDRGGVSGADRPGGGNAAHSRPVLAGDAEQRQEPGGWAGCGLCRAPRADACPCASGNAVHGAGATAVCAADSIKLSVAAPVDRARVLIASLIVGCSALAMSWKMSIGGANETAATTLYGAFFLIALARAYRYVRRREFVLHREWMIRAYAIGLAVATIRPIVGGIVATARPIAYARIIHSRCRTNSRRRTYR